MNNLKWMGHTQTIIEMQKRQIEDLNYCDVKLSCGGKLFSAHKIILSSCSDFFREIFKNSPDLPDLVVILPDIKDFILENIISFVYTGEVSLSSATISDFLESINILGIKSAISFECHLKKDFQKPVVQTNTTNTTLTAITMEVDEEQEEEMLETKQSKDGYIEDEIDTVDSNQAQTEQISTSTSVTEFQTGPTQKIQFLEVYNPSKMGQYAIEQLESETAGESTEDEAGVADDYILTEHPDNTYTLSDSKHMSSGEIKQIVFESTPKIRRKNSTNIRPKSEISDSNSSRNESFSKAMDDVLNQGLSLQKAAEKYGVSKTVLWRRVRKHPNYNKVFRENPIIEAAIAKLEKGESLKNVSESLSIPISTLHRHKIRLVAEGRLPDHYQVKRRTLESKKMLQEKLLKAVEACNNGMSQNHAASVFEVPKSTLWRYMKKIVAKDFKGESKTEFSDNKELLIEEANLSENAVEAEDMCDETANEIETVNIDQEQTELVEEF